MTLQPASHTLALGPDQDLAYWTLGEQFNAAGQPRPALLLLHGMRDVGRGLLPVAQAVADRYFCVLPDLRGHGHSYKPGAYAIQHFLQDIRQLCESLQFERCALVGHSLGGHLACRYAGLYPAAVTALVVIEGLGPPQPHDVQAVPAADLARTAAQLDASLLTRARAAQPPRVMPDKQTAQARLQASNPRLHADWARDLVEWSVVPVAGGYAWAFDPRAQEVFLGISHQRNTDYWRNVAAPTFIIMGDHGFEYWRGMRNEQGYSGQFGEGELASRVACFPQAQLAWIQGAGHQVHYDQPQQLAERCREFLFTAPITATAPTAPVTAPDLN